MARLSENNRKILLTELNRLIDMHSEDIIAQLSSGTFSKSYPPDKSLSAHDKKLLEKIIDTKEAKTAIREVLTECSARVLFDLLNWFDGTGDPNDPGWTGVTLIDSPHMQENEDNPSLHDDFFDRYWDWLKISGQDKPQRG